MAELGKHGKRKASNEDGPSNFPLFSHMADGEIDDDENLGGDDTDRDTRQDPLEVFGSEIMTVMLSKVDARSVAIARLVCRGWHAVASSDKIWAPKKKVCGHAKASDVVHKLFARAIRRNRDIELSEICNVCPHFQCEELWLGKRHIARISKVQGLPKLAAYSLSLMDGKRTRITRQDLCDHVWEFHFTATAPEYWRNLDPYWSGSGPVMRRYFHPDGSVTAGPGDRVWGGHESSYTVVTGLLADGKIRDHYVRINRWPKLNVQRRDDWGWELCNHLYTYTSVADADDKEDGTGPFFPLF
ncbi:hypothetical protein BUALT_Bualt12G0103800 [Buddleja alternifolia]|uniref:F-box domain-containing protein n=1 Tax=Buddleja alternifolia TaxID=168488 RepID=A0AAV6WWE3_9LAMI|nr:hypothetical protein BUALT_Bualt12G0103800 [Buddleja alternifolia]